MSRTWTCTRVSGGVKCGHKMAARLALDDAKRWRLRDRRCWLFGHDVYAVKGGGHRCRKCGEWVGW